MAASTVITSERLARLGIPAALSAILVNKTIAEACVLYQEDLAIVIGAAGVDSRGMVSYTLEGQTVTTSMDDVRKLVTFLQQSMSAGSGGLSIPVRFAL